MTGSLSCPSSSETEALWMLKVSSRYEMAKSTSSLRGRRRPHPQGTAAMLWVRAGPSVIVRTVAELRERTAPGGDRRWLRDSGA